MVISWAVFTFLSLIFLSPARTASLPMSSRQIPSNAMFSLWHEMLSMKLSPSISSLRLSQSTSYGIGAPHISSISLTRAGKRGILQLFDLASFIEAHGPSLSNLPSRPGTDEPRPRGRILFEEIHQQPGHLFPAQQGRMRTVGAQIFALPHYPVRARLQTVGPKVISLGAA